MRVAIVTPTINSKHLSHCLESVQKQTYKDITHYVFVDGKDYIDSVNERITIGGNIPIELVMMTDNVGKGWYGHRVYAASSFLVNADVIVYLDEDNWFDSDHVEKLVEKLKQGNDWVYSLRKIYDKEGNFLTEDNCESLGKWPVYFNNDVYHIDTSSFAIKRDIAVRIGHAWYGQWGADRQFFTAIKQHFPKFDCTNAHSLCYRLDGNPNSVTKEFFDEGNRINQQKYNGEFPWKQKQSSLLVVLDTSVPY